MKKALALTLCVLLSFSVLCAPSFAAQGAPSLRINGNALNLSPAPYIEDGRMMVPLSAFADSIGAAPDISVAEDGSQVIYVSRSSRVVGLIVGLKAALVNNAEVETDVAPVMKDQEIFVPLRVVCEALKLKVEWAAETKTASVSEMPVVFELPTKLSETPFNLLGGRMTVKMPEGAETGDSSTETEENMCITPTWLSIESGDQYMYLDANETFLKAGSDLVASAKKYLAITDENDGEFTFSAVKSQNGLSVVSYAPKTPISQNGYVLMLGAVVCGQDGMMTNIGFFFDPESFLTPDACSNLASSVLDTLAAGPKKLVSGARDVDMFGGKLSLRLTDGFASMHQTSSSYNSFTFVKNASVGETLSSFAVYMSDVPLMEEPQAGIASQIDGKKVIWRNTNEDGQTSQDFYYDTMLTLGEGDGESYMHIFVNGSTEQVAKDLMKLAETIKIK